MSARADYKSLGARAHLNRKPRDSCRYKAADIVRDWVAGWDEAEAARIERERRLAIPRWQSDGRISVLSCSVLPEIRVWQAEDEGEVYPYKLSVHAWGIECSFNSIDIAHARRAAISIASNILRARIAELDAVAHLDGSLIDQEMP